MLCDVGPVVQRGIQRVFLARFKRNVSAFLTFCPDEQLIMIIYHDKAFFSTPFVSMAIMYSKFELGLLLNVGRIDPNGLRGIRQFQTNKVVSDSPANSASDEPNTLPILNLGTFQDFTPFFCIE